MGIIGSNVPTIGGVHKGFEWASRWGCESIQIYVTPSRRWEVPPLSKTTIDGFRLAWQKSLVREVVAHVPFLVNLASPNIELWKKSIQRLVTEITVADQLGVRFLVLHPGSFVDSTKESGIARIIMGLKTVLTETENLNVSVLLETMSGQGSMIGSKFEDLRLILQKVNVPHRLGVCFDTAHVFEAGYDLRGYDGLACVMAMLDDCIGISNLKVFHLNDSLTDLASRVDRHAALGVGKLGLQVFHALVRDRRFNDISMILEEPEQKTQSVLDLNILRGLRAHNATLNEVKQDSFQPELLKGE